MEEHMEVLLASPFGPEYSHRCADRVLPVIQLFQRSRARHGWTRGPLPAFGNAIFDGKLWDTFVVFLVQSQLVGLAQSSGLVDTENPGDFARAAQFPKGGAQNSAFQFLQGLSERHLEQFVIGVCGGGGLCPIRQHR